ncbi:MAG TPA: ribonuclease H-like domain-containing protein, partial [Candidatus Erysipelatoclostridium merdavium]|nr:ribonuclease H-like domain-containing protein [Candidatus Erysipelatoclostridium merdavium]
MPPHILFEKEKEYLRPLPNKVMLDSYVDNVITQIVPPTLLVTYNGSGYSVPTKFINKRVKLVPIEN